VTSRARATACTVLRLGPEQFAGNGGGAVHDELRRVDLGAFVTDNGYSRNVEVADIDDDGDLDVLIANDVDENNAMYIFEAPLWHTGVSNHGCTAGNLTPSSHKDSEGGRSTLVFMASSPGALEVSHGR
jgi:hypothetical protein